MTPLPKTPSAEPIHRPWLWVVLALIFPMLVAACLWYLAITSVLMVGQYFIERRFSRSERGVRGRIVGGAR